ncbi:MAG: hypothetical protein WC980_03685 [Candidatus Brocadiia bacterium]
MCLKCGCQGVVNLDQREYLGRISLHPFKDEVVASGDHIFYVTAVDTAPNTVDLIFYIESSLHTEGLLVKRPVYSEKEIWFATDDCPVPQKFIPEPDNTGVSTLRYLYDKPVHAKLRISTTSTDNKAISAETSIQIGSPEPSYFFLIIFGIIIMLSIVFAYLKKGCRSFTDKGCQHIPPLEV